MNFYFIKLNNFILNIPNNKKGYLRKANEKSEFKSLKGHTGAINALENADEHHIVSAS